MDLSQEDRVKYKSLFVQTAQEYVTALQKNLSLFVTDASNKEAINGIFVAAHSLTSQSLLMGYTQTGNFVSLIEKIFRAKKDNASYEIGSALVELIQKGVEKIDASITEIEKDDKEADVSEEIRELESLSGFKSGREQT